ncbi:MAG: 4Fe-4S dicluster domain-containing protein [Candidatus Nitrosocaldus sp.]|nr:4Fe-4S dicluster domain-containing protein [Candidatus Nitrosocaldus sp.]MDW8000824.1 4Fe-4S dicluster domain-containing protein [Candidatus Nitrosocaldus sp.]
MPFIVERSDFGQFFTVLKGMGYEIIGPRVRDSAIVYDRLGSVDDLPIGITDHQEKGVYRLRRRDDQALFGYTVGPHSWKMYLFPPRVRLFSAERRAGNLEVVEERHEPRRLAFIGVRACELHAIQIQDRVFLHDIFKDPVYEMLRKDVFILAVSCTVSSSTCFCTSMGTGPRVGPGYDIAVIEVLKPVHHFLIEVGSSLGGEVLSNVRHREATREEVESATQLVESNARLIGMRRSMDTSNIKELLYSSYGSKHWDEVAERCLACANCTMVCPTCFCSTVEDVVDLKGEHAERWRLWDSCFSNEFTYMHSGTVRRSTGAKYRHWITHKLASWIDQFGTSGCVGCGRCITWCPVGIDITEEVKALQRDGGGGGG